MDPPGAPGNTPLSDTVLHHDNPNDEDARNDLAVNTLHTEGAGPSTSHRPPATAGDIDVDSISAGGEDTASEPDDEDEDEDEDGTSDEDDNEESSRQEVDTLPRPQVFDQRAAHRKQQRSLRGAADARSGEAPDELTKSDVENKYGTNMALLCFELSHLVITGAVAKVEKQLTEQRIVNGASLIWEQLAYPDDKRWKRKLLELARMVEKKAGLGDFPYFDSLVDIEEYFKDVTEEMIPTVIGTAFELFVANSMLSMKEENVPFSIEGSNYTIQHVFMSGKLPKYKVCDRFAVAGDAQAALGEQFNNLKSEMKSDKGTDIAVVMKVSGSEDEDAFCVLMIQCKFRSYSWCNFTAKEASTFRIQVQNLDKVKLEGHRYQGIWCTNGYYIPHGFGSGRESVVQNEILALGLFTGLTATDLRDKFGSPRHLKVLLNILEGANVSAIPSTYFEERPRQTKTIREAVKHFEDGNQAGQILMPCGSGKTYTSSRIQLLLKLPKGRRTRLTLFVAPLRRLAVQTFDSLLKTILDSHHQTSSEENVAEHGESQRNEPPPLHADLAVFASDIGSAYLGIRQLDRASLKNWLQAAAKDILDNENSQDSSPAHLHGLITTYNSCPVVKEVAAEIFEEVVFDLVIADEAHYTTGHLDKPFCTVHKIPARHRLYLTATPRIFHENLKKEGDRWNEIMGDTTIEDHRVLNDAIEQENQNDDSSDEEDDDTLATTSQNADKIQQPPKKVQRRTRRGRGITQTSEASYNEGIHACQKDKHGVFGSVIDIIGWGEMVDLGHLCPITIRMLQTSWPEAEAKVLLGREVWLTAVETTKPTPEEEEQADRALLGETSGAPRGRLKRQGPERSSLATAAYIAIASNVLDDMVHGRAHGDATVPVTHVVVYLSNVKRCFLAQGVFQKLIEKKAKDFDNNDDVLAAQYRSIATCVVSSYQNTRDTNASLEHFRRSKLAIVFNVGIMKIGQDIPEVDAVVFMDPINSPIDIIQIAGRALRPCGLKKKQATAYIPILQETVAEDTAFDPEEAEENEGEKVDKLLDDNIEREKNYKPIKEQLKMMSEPERKVLLNFVEAALIIPGDIGNSLTFESSSRRKDSRRKVLAPETKGDLELLAKILEAFDSKDIYYALDKKIKNGLDELWKELEEKLPSSDITADWKRKAEDCIVDVIRVVIRLQLRRNPVVIAASLLWGHAHNISQVRKPIEEAVRKVTGVKIKVLGIGVLAAMFRKEDILPTYHLCGKVNEAFEQLNKHLQQKEEETRPEVHVHILNLITGILESDKHKLAVDALLDSAHGSANIRYEPGNIVAALVFGLQDWWTMDIRKKELSEIVEGALGSKVSQLKTVLKKLRKLEVVPWPLQHQLIREMLDKLAALFKSKIDPSKIQQAEGVLVGITAAKNLATADKLKELHKYNHFGRRNAAGIAWGLLITSLSLTLASDSYLKRTLKEHLLGVAGVKDIARNYERKLRKEIYNTRLAKELKELLEKWAKSNISEMAMKDHPDLCNEAKEKVKAFYQLKSTGVVLDTALELSLQITRVGEEVVEQKTKAPTVAAALVSIALTKHNAVGISDELVSAGAMIAAGKSIISWPPTVLHNVRSKIVKKLGRNLQSEDAKNFADRLSALLDKYTEWSKTDVSKVKSPTHPTNTPYCLVDKGIIDSVKSLIPKMADRLATNKQGAEKSLPGLLAAMVYHFLPPISSTRKIAGGAEVLIAAILASGDEAEIKKLNQKKTLLINHHYKKMCRDLTNEHVQPSEDGVVAPSREQLTDSSPPTKKQRKSQ